MDRDTRRALHWRVVAAAEREPAHRRDVAHECELVIDRPASVRTVHLGHPHGAAVPGAQAVDQRNNVPHVASVCITQHTAREGCLPTGERGRLMTITCAGQQRDGLPLDSVRTPERLLLISGTISIDQRAVEAGIVRLTDVGGHEVDPAVGAVAEELVQPLLSSGGDAAVKAAVPGETSRNSGQT